jgi:hypothetical protein
VLKNLPEKRQDAKKKHPFSEEEKTVRGLPTDILYLTANFRRQEEKSGPRVTTRLASFIWVSLGGLNSQVTAEVRSEGLGLSSSGLEKQCIFLASWRFSYFIRSEMVPWGIESIPLGDTKYTFRGH